MYTNIAMWISSPVALAVFSVIVRGVLAAVSRVAFWTNSRLQRWPMLARGDDGTKLRSYAMQNAFLEVIWLFVFFLDIVSVHGHGTLMNGKYGLRSSLPFHEALLSARSLMFGPLADCSADILPSFVGDARHVRL